jgi:integrase
LESVSPIKSQAEKRLTIVLGQIAESRYETGPKVKLEYDEAVRLYKTYLESIPNEQTRRFYIQRLDTFLSPFFKDFSAYHAKPILPRQLTTPVPIFIEHYLPQHLSAYMVYCRDELKHSNSTINRGRATLLNMINCFVKGRILRPDGSRYLTYNPIASVPAYKENDARESFFYTIEEVKTLLINAALVHKRAPLFIGLGCFGGLRKMTILLLKKEYVNLTYGDYGVIAVPASKRKQGKYTHYVIMTQLLRQIYDSYLSKCSKEELESEWLFPSENTKNHISIPGWDKCWNKIKKNSGIKNKRFHDTKHTAGTFMYEETQDIRKVADFLDHSDINMSRKYSFRPDEEKMKTVKGFGDKFSSIKI